MSTRASRGMVVAITTASAMALPTVSAVTAGAAPASGTSFPATSAPAPGGPVGGLPGSSAPPPADSPITPEARAFGQSIKVVRAKRHLERLQEIADDNGDTRASGTPGHNASVTYVADWLRAAGYRVTLQEFTFPFFRNVTFPLFRRIISNVAKPYINNTDFRTVTYSGSGNVRARVQGVDLTLPPTPKPSSTSGCQARDFARFVRGGIALIQRGGCSFQTKAERARAAGASGVIIFNEGQAGEGADDRRGLLHGSLDAPTVKLPVVSTTYAVGRELSARGTIVTLVTDTESDPRRATRNIIAESDWGDPNRVVMLGAHLDSVPDGPGIDDNGSGVASILETALAAKDLRARNKLRFAFWSCHEFGLRGSEHYLAGLSPTEKANIRLYLNFDVIASPNYVLGIYDGDDSDGAGAPAGPPGSDRIEKLFESYFAETGRPYRSVDTAIRSEYGPFAASGIPSGGLFTGTVDIKTAKEAVLFGGRAGVAYDPCYHLRCDTIVNISDTALGLNSGAIATAAFVYARADDLPGGSAPGSGGPPVATDVPN
ncbi:M28 family peptidase [Streptosporangium amethystogenes subsp. fukuiense]|uniref:M28 family peptidase n=1 Tax=Streptosporangium amethystogenes subsp. fukuiense TaxID=698418 RepID=A0ABW2TB81_9ACTN